MSAGPITKAAWDKPPISLVDPATGDKIRFQLRQMSFARELRDLPSDMLELNRGIVADMQASKARVYDAVMKWNKLRVHEKYWKSFEFSAEAEYLAYYNLPDGNTLGGWTLMVNLFDRTTFVFLGDEVLSYMMRTVGEYESDTDQRKKAYQAIFDGYCDAHDSFDRPRFYETIRAYVAEKYEKPQARVEGVSIEKWRKQRSANLHGMHRGRKIVCAPGEQEITPRVTKDFAWRRDSCKACKVKDKELVAQAKLIKTLTSYIHILERVIKKHASKRLPVRPKELKDI